MLTLYSVESWHDWVYKAKGSLKSTWRLTDFSILVCAHKQQMQSLGNTNLKTERRSPFPPWQCVDPMAKVKQTTQGQPPSVNSILTHLSLMPTSNHSWIGHWNCVDGWRKRQTVQPHLTLQAGFSMGRSEVTVSSPGMHTHLHSDDPWSSYSISCDGNSKSLHKGK